MRFRVDSDAAPRVAVRVRDFGHVQIKGGVHGPLIQLRALSNKTLAALLVQIKIRVRRLEPASNDVVAKLPRLAHAARRRSQSHVDGVTVSESRIGAVAAKLKLRNSKKMTLSQHHAGSTRSVGSGSATEGTVACDSHVLLKATKTRPRS